MNVFDYYDFSRNNVWALCPTGFYLNGLRKSDGGDLHNIEEGQCCRPVNQPDNKYYDCYDEDVTMSFDNKGWNQCQREGYFMTGLYKSNCDKIYCIEKLKCCRMKPRNVILLVFHFLTRPLRG